MNASKAEQVRKSIAKAFPSHADMASEIKIVHDWNRDGDCMIFWEEGPDNWTLAYCDMAAGFDRKDEEFGFTHKASKVRKVAGVGFEPYYSFAMSIWKED